METPLSPGFSVFLLITNNQWTKIIREFTEQLIVTYNFYFFIKLKSLHLDFNTYPAQLSASIFGHLKLELLTQIPASNDKIYLYV